LWEGLGLAMREHDPNFRPPALPGAGWRFAAVGHAPQPGERCEAAVAVGLEGVQVSGTAASAPAASSGSTTWRSSPSASWRGKEATSNDLAAVLVL
jgi:hypothetical protein